MSVSLTSISDTEADAPAANAVHDIQDLPDPPAYPGGSYTPAEVDAKIRELDHALRSDMVSAFEEFEKVLRRTRVELAQERYARKDFGETSAMRINQLQAMVDELAPRVSPQRHGATHARRSERTEQQRRQWEGMLWHD